ncbi:MAG: hypothetical protein ABSB41_02930 [Anaerolineales bacterium]|jgi:hypothetical protein
MNTTVFIVKLILTPLIVAMVTVIARRWGESIGGLLIGLPLTSGPVSIFLALEQGQHFAAGAANSAMLGLIAVTAFYVAYVQSAKRLAWYFSALIGISIYAVVVLGISILPIGIWLTTILVPLVLLAGMLTLGKRVTGGFSVSPPWWDLPIRMVFATGLLLLITAGASMLGSEWSGLLSPFPIFTFVMVTFSHRQGGANAARRFIQGVSLGLFSYVAFFLVVRSLIERSSLLVVYALATLLALLVNGTFLGIQLFMHRSVIPLDKPAG